MAVELKEWTQHTGKFLQITLDSGKVFAGKFVGYEFKNPLNWVREDGIFLHTNTPGVYTLHTREIAQIKILDEPFYFDPN